MLLDIDLTANEPIYRQIRAQIVRALATGELSAGDALPSVRALAAQLGINMHTVNKAYALLRDEGYIHLRGRSGAYIAEPSSNAPRSTDFSLKLTQLALEFRAQGGSRDEFIYMAQSAYNDSLGGEQ